MAEQAQADVSIPSSRTSVLAAKSKAAGLSVRFLKLGGSSFPASSEQRVWACVPASQLSALLDRALAAQARIAGPKRGTSYEEGGPIAIGVTFDDLVSPEKRYSRGSRRGTEQAPRQADVPEISDADLQRLLDEELGQEGRERTPRDVLRDKATAAIVRLVDKASEQAALEALAAPDDVSSLVSFLASSEMARVLATEARDPLAGAIARGTAQRKSLVDAEGGTASAQEIADLLGITRQAVDKRRRKGALLAVPSGSNDWRYPRWQILEGHVLPGFERVMAAFEATGPWTRLHFFLSANERLADQRPLDALRLADIEPVIEAAAALGEHGAS